MRHKYISKNDGNKIFDNVFSFTHTLAYYTKSLKPFAGSDKLINFKTHNNLHNNLSFSYYGDK